jgi:Fe-S cluster biogenesis protein NfuA
MTGAAQVGTRVEELLARLRTSAGETVAATAEELVGLLIGLYGDGLGRIVAVLRDSGDAGARTLARLTEDPLVESLLLLHDLHPLDVGARIQRALDRVRPYLGSHAGGVEYLGVTDGVARLRLEGSCHGCPSSTVTVQLAIQGAVEEAAPEVTRVVVEGMTEAPGPALLQIGRRPADEAGAGAGPAALAGSGGDGAGDGGGADGGNEAGWVTLPDIGPPSSRPVTASAAGTSVLVCSVRGTLYAYRDACAACGSSLAGGTLERELLTCPACAARYDVRLAGKALDDPAAHLDPLPLLADSRGVRVALPQAART